MKKVFALFALLALMAGLAAEQVTVSNDRFAVDVQSYGLDRTELTYTLGSFEREPVDIDGETWYSLALPGEGRTAEVGLPQLPKVTRALVVGDDAYMEVHFLDGDYVDLTMNVAPSKGNFSRTIDPATVPYTFGSAYTQDAFWPAVNGDRNAPYIMRDIRGIAVNAYPFQYNPATHTLRVWYRLHLEVVRTGVDTQNVKTRHAAALNRSFYDIYSRRFVNLTPTRYDTLGQNGSILVVCYPNFMEAMQPWVDWKIQKGFDVQLVDVTTIGTSASAIMSYIQNLYDTPGSDLTYVQLVGDAAQIPTFSVSGGGSDPSYSLLEGNDSYPDIYVGRFSAESVADVETQVERSIYYERDITGENSDWLHKGTGIASALGSGQGHNGEADYQHMNLIRNDLMDYTYTDVDQIYDNNGGTAAMVTSALNEGRSVVDYCGHGSNTTWVSTGFSNTHVNALTNDNRLPFIQSIACVNGNFVSITCFAEAWLRATDNTTGEPTGAIAFYGSSINQDWDTPMDSQDEFIALMVGEVRNTTGSLYYNGSCLMLDNYGNAGVSMFKTWHIFGDCSIQVRTDSPTPFALDYLPSLFIGLESFEVNAGVEDALVCLSYNGEILGRGFTGPDGSAVLQLNNVPEEPCDLTLTVTGYNKTTFVGTLPLQPNDCPYVIIDDPEIDDNGNGVIEFGETLSLSADCENVGNEPAYSATAVLTCNDEYVTLLDYSENIGTITSSTLLQLNDIFSLRLADNIPDLHEVTLTITITAEDAEGETYEWSHSALFTAHGPNIAIGNFNISDGAGNNNGKLDPGETVVLSIPLQNTGSCNSPDVIGRLVCNNTYVTISQPEVTIGVMEPGASETVTFTVGLSEDVPGNDIIPIGLGVFAGAYVFQASILQGTPALVENFENGLNYMGWTMSGDADWTLDTDNAYEGTYCLRSGAITDGQTTSAEFDYDVTATGSMVFYRNTASEINADYLRLYIDGNLKGQWSGLSQWLPITIALTDTGVHTFRWTYSKDQSVSSGYDCAWIDNITFPGVTPDPMPIIALSRDAVEFTDVPVHETASTDVTLYNFGTANLAGTIQTPECFTAALPSRTRGNNAQRENVRDSYEFELTPFETLTFTLFFTPTAGIDYSGEVIFATNDPYAPELALPITANGYDSVGNNPDNRGVTALQGNYPNPFNPATNVSFSLSASEQVELMIYNVRGQRVKTLVNETLQAGSHSVTWNGDTDGGGLASSGVYFLSMKAGRYTAVKKMILLK